MSSLPIDHILPELRSALERATTLLLGAAPGAGKTTRVPLALVHDHWLAGKKIVMLEPRRLAAQRAAAYMAQLLRERVGETVGFRIRGETRVSSRTRIEVVTEGILTRMMQDDQSLSGVGLVIFDEFHERSLHADLGLAFALDVQRHLRNDLRILLMSATLDDGRIASLVADAPIVKSEGRAFPVVTHYVQHEPKGSIEQIVADAVVRALNKESGDILVFLPGQREIRRVEQLLVDKGLPDDVLLTTLYGEASLEQQRAALSPAPPRMRKVILSTNVAETSLTIDGVRVVIDSGLMRTVSFDPRRGMTGLITVPVSQANAEQRRGRAGRQQPGVCYRLWTEKRHAELSRFHPPEILVSDLAALALELARWGDPLGEHLQFLDPPPKAHLAQARTLLAQLGALDAEGRLTAHGRAMADLPTHPRLAHMMLRGKQRGLGALACDVAAMLEERDLLHGERDRDIDLASRWHILQSGRARDRFVVDRAQRQAERYRKMIGVKNEKGSERDLGILLALAYPERVAKQREKDGVRYQLAGGTSATLPKSSILSRERYLAVGEVDGAGSEVRILLAAPISEEDIVSVFSEELVSNDEVRWDEKREAVVGERVTRLGAVELSAVPITPSQELVRSMLMEAIRKRGLDILPWTKESRSIKDRSEWLRMRSLVGNDWPVLSDDHLVATLDEWLAPFVVGMMGFAQLQKLDMKKVMRAQFSHEKLRLLDRLAPTHVTVPTGLRIQLDYTSDPPVLAVRVQEMFGETETPTIADGKEKVMLHLLSPAQRPVAVTQDLPSFWQNAYTEVRKHMRGRYPKHDWPENPMHALPKKRRNLS